MRLHAIAISLFIKYFAIFGRASVHLYWNYDDVVALGDPSFPFALPAPHLLLIRRYCGRYARSVRSTLPHITANEKIDFEPEATASPGMDIDIDSCVAQSRQ